MGERVADALSKGNFKEVQEEMPGAVDVSHRTSDTNVSSILLFPVY